MADLTPPSSKQGTPLRPTASTEPVSPTQALVVDSKPPHPLAHAAGDTDEDAESTNSLEGEGEYYEEDMVGMSEDELVPGESRREDVLEGEDMDLEGTEGGEGEGEGEGEMEAEGEVESMGEGAGVGENGVAGAAGGVGAGGAQSEGKGKGKAKAPVSDTLILSSWVLLARHTATGLEDSDADAGADAMQVRRRGKGRAAEKKRAAGATPAKVQRREVDLYESEIVARWNAGERAAGSHWRSGSPLVSGQSFCPLSKVDPLAPLRLVLRRSLRC